MPWRRRPIYFSATSSDVGYSLSGFVRKKVMLSSVGAEVDFIEELRLRRWARENYVQRDRRQLSWHPVILDEMGRKDVEMSEAEAVCTCA